jgi:hypothetical protein
MNIPATIRAGDTVIWRDKAAADLLGNPITSGTYTLTYYLRTNIATEGATVVATPYGDGWEATISSAVSADFNAGVWYWQAVATANTTKHTLGTGQLTVEAALNYAGTPGAFDGRSQAEKDLEAVTAAIRALVASGAKEYTIGGRSFKKQDLNLLIQRESQLKAIVKREQAADLIKNGLGDPRSLYVRF